MRTLVVANQKGGVGKTTVTLNLAAELADFDLRVLAIDLDAQCNLTTGLGVNADPSRTVYQVLVAGAPVRDAVVRVRNFHLLPGSPSLATAEKQLIDEMAREQRLSDALEPIRDEFEFVLIDCPPALGLLTLNAFVAADEVVAPVHTAQWAYDSLKTLTETVAKVRVRLNPRLAIRHIVPTIYDRRLGHHNAILEALQALASETVTVHSPISYTTRIPEASSAHLPLRDHDRNTGAADGFEKLAAKLLAAATRVER
jgi:chromosome partitioning protein